MKWEHNIKKKVCYGRSSDSSFLFKRYELVFFSFLSKSIFVIFFQSKINQTFGDSFLITYFYDFIKCSIEVHINIRKTLLAEVVTKLIIEFESSRPKLPSQLWCNRFRLRRQWKGETFSFDLIILKWLDTRIYNTLMAFQSFNGRISYNPFEVDSFSCMTSRLNFYVIYYNFMIRI